MNTARQLRCLVGMTAFAVNLSDMVGMRIFLDVGVAIIALQAAVDAGAELIAVNGDAVSGCILHRLVSMAGETVGLCGKAMRPEKDRECHKAERGRPVMSEYPRHIGQPFGCPHNNCDEECYDSCGFGHAAVFFLHVA